MNGLGTITLKDSSWYDERKKYQREHNKPFSYREWWYTKKTLEINPLWRRCFSGREEYA